MRETDSMIAILASIVAVLVIGPSLLASRITGWLIDHRVLTPASADPIVVIPATGGAGLDGRRLLTFITVLVLMTSIGFLTRIRKANKEA